MKGFQPNYYIIAVPEKDPLNIMAHTPEPKMLGARNFERSVAVLHD